MGNPACITRNGQTTAYRYDSEGTRIRKTNADGSYIRYHVVDGRTVGHTEYDAGGARRLDMRYTFDQNGAPAGFSLKNAGETAWTEYYFVKNPQGDVLKVYKAADNSLAAAYTYDPFGKIRTSTGSLANTNPFRYRGYFYDAETGFYYLQSRYYDPITCRFINADSYASTGQGFVGYNMFAYCNNDPINCVDPFGFLAYPGEIHGAVVRHLAERYALYTEQYITYKVGWGRADLISRSGKVWEVKPDKPRHIKKGKEQVKKYVNNTWKNNPQVDLSIGDYIESGNFSYVSGATTYHVTYRYAGDGVIAYDYSKKTDWSRVVATAGTAALIVGAAYLIAQTGGIAAPVVGGVVALLG